MRLIGVDGGQIGVVSLRDALEISEQEGLDLVEISPYENPVVCKVMDYGKFLYEEKKRKPKKSTNILKEVRLSIRIGQADFDQKIKRIKEFLDAGLKVKVTIRFRGREMYRISSGTEILKRITENLSQETMMLEKPTMGGRMLSMVLYGKNKG